MEMWSSCIRPVLTEEGPLWCDLAMSDGATLLLLVGGASVGQGAVPMVPACRGMDG